MNSKSILINFYNLKPKNPSTSLIHPSIFLNKSINLHKPSFHNDYLFDYFKTPHHHKRIQSSSFFIDKSTKHASLNESQEHLHFPSIKIKSRANDIINVLLLPSNQTPLKRANYKKRPLQNHIYEKVYSNRILHVESGKKLISNKMIEPCYGNEMLMEEGINKVKFVMEKRNYRDVEIVNWERKKTKGLDEFGGDEEGRRFGFRKKGVLREYEKKKKGKLNVGMKLSFDEKIRERMRKCGVIMNNVNEITRKINMYKEGSE